VSAIGEVWRKLLLVVRRDRATRDLEDEMRLHVALRAESLEGSGLSNAEAARAATRRFGNPTGIAEWSRDMWGFGAIGTLRQDLRYAARRLRQHPGFTASVVVVLALGIGATTAMFSAVDAAMLRPLPFVRPAELVTLRRIAMPYEGRLEANPFNFMTVSDMPVFASVAAYASGGLNLSEQDHPQRLNAGVVSVNFFSTLGVLPVRGRAFGADDVKPGVRGTAILSWGLWQRQFGGADVIGTTISLSANPYQIIGVMPNGFGFPDRSDVWVPMNVPITQATYAPFRGYLPSRVIARVETGISVAAADAQLRARWGQYISSLPVSPGRRLNIMDSFDDVKANGAAVPLRTELGGDRRGALLILLGATALLLLIACANVTNLLLSYGATRGRELAVRAVLGATRARVIRQLLSESVLLSVAGAALGVLLAPIVLRVLRALMPGALAGVAPAQLDLRVLAFASVLGIITGVAFGMWPAFGATRVSVAQTVKAGGGHGATVAGTRRLQRTFVAAELAMATMLLVGAGLMLRSFSQVMRTDSGLNPERTATLELSFPRGADKSVVTAKLDAMLARLHGVSGISAAGVVNDLPLRSDGGISSAVYVDGAPPETKPVFVRPMIASGNYFTAIGIPLRRGRVFQRTDDASAQPVAIVSEGMAKTFWPNADPLGRTFRQAGDTAHYVVVGIVGDVREAGLERKPKPQMYFSPHAAVRPDFALVARGTLEPRVLLAQLTDAVRAVDPAQAVYNVRMMDAVIGASVASRRANTLLISLFGVLALAISVLGVYAVTANAVAQRSREFGIRSALGATGRDLVRHIGGEMTWVAVAGVALGSCLAWALSRVMASLLYGVTTHDSATFAAAPAALVVAAVVATILPARRALRVNPADVMRSD
jgi:predicted permease